MSPLQLRRIFKRHYGASSDLARQLGLHRTTVSKWFKGQVTSARLETAIRQRAAELLEGEVIRRAHRG